MSSPLDFSAFRDFAETGLHVSEGAIAESECDALLSALSDLIERRAREHLEDAKPERSFWELLRASAHGADVFCDESQGSLRELSAAEWEGRAMRIGHGLHVVEPAFAHFSRLPQIAGPLRRLAHVAAMLSRGASPEDAASSAFEAPSGARFLQSAVIYKQPQSDAVQFGFHRDAAYLPNEPESLMLAFVALDRMTPENGCLTVIPRTHTEPLWMRFRLGSQGFVEIGREPRPAEGRRVVLPLSRGSVAFVHGRTMHASAPNRSDAPRRALIVHAMSDMSELSKEAWVQAPPGGFAPLD